MSKTTERIERRLAYLAEQAEAARKRGDYLYVTHNATLADELQWLLDAEASDTEVTIERHMGHLIGGFLQEWRFEFDEFVSQSGVIVSRGEIAKLIEQLTERVPSRAPIAAARQATAGDM